MKYLKLQKRVKFVLIALIIFILFSSYFLFFYTKPLETGQKFIESMAYCKRVSWVKEDAQASWLYIIQGETKGDACKIKVKLLKMKQGTLKKKFPNAQES